MEMKIEIKIEIEIEVQIEIEMEVEIDIEIEKEKGIEMRRCYKYWCEFNQYCKHECTDEYRYNYDHEYTYK